MAGIDLERARKLLESAETLFEADDYHGVAGLAYQAFESAVMCLIEIRNGMDQRSHAGRRKRAKELLKEYRDRIDTLWDIRNIDFYGNISVGKQKREITRKEAEENLETVKSIIEEVERFTREENP